MVAVEIPENARFAVPEATALPSFVTALGAVWLLRSSRKLSSSSQTVN
jgi:hypothetical protein